jgi:hypothetical protein
MRYVFVTAAALTICGAALAQYTGTDRDQTQTQTGMQNQVDRAQTGAQNQVDRAQATAEQGLQGTAAAPDAEDIRDVLGQVAEASLTEDGFDDLVERFVDADRNRIGQAMPNEGQLESLNTLAKQIGDAWKTKYNGEFDITDEELVFGTVRIQQGEIGDQARLAGERQTGQTGVDNPVNTNNPQSPADQNLNDPGRNIATVTIPAGHGLSEIRVPMIHEMPDSWRIDVPDTLTADKLRTNLETHLRQVQQMQAQWPSNKDQAAMAVTHHVLLALFEGSPQVQQTGAMMGQPGQLNQPGQTNRPGTPQPGQSPARSDQPAGADR